MLYADVAEVTPLGCHWPMEQWGDNKGNLIKMHPHSRNKLLLEFLEREFTRRNILDVFRCVRSRVRYLRRLHCASSSRILFYLQTEFSTSLLRCHYYIIMSRVNLIFFVILNAENFHIQYPVLHKITNARGRDEDLKRKRKKKQAKRKRWNVFSSKLPF